MTPRRVSMRISVRVSIFVAILGLSLLALLAGCGYRVEGHVNALPASIHVVEVTPFQNATRTPGISQSITAAISRELIHRTRYRVQPDADQADAQLTGTVKEIIFTPVTFDPVSGRATTMEVRMHIAADLTDLHTHKVLFHNDDMIFHDQYQISPQLPDFFEEDTSAFQRMSQTVAQTLVSNILENF